MICPLTNSFFGLIGVLVGGLIVHRLTLARESDARKRAFRSFLRKWRSEISSFNPPEILGRQTIFSFFKSKLPDFDYEVDLVRDAFRDSRKFETLTKNIRDLKEQDCKDKPREAILYAIDELIRFCTKKCGHESVAGRT